MPPPPDVRPTPRERLLAAADHLFYEQGVCSVGIDRILRDANVARASLYTTYGSKDELIRAYLQSRSDGWKAVVSETLPTRWDTPRERMIGIFTLLTEWFAAPGYRGCPFINASAEEASGRSIEDVRDGHRAWVHELFSSLAREAAVTDPAALANQLILLYDGSMVGAQLDGDAAPGGTAQVAAATLIDSAATD